MGLFPTKVEVKPEEPKEKKPIVFVKPQIQYGNEPVKQTVMVPGDPVKVQLPEPTSTSSFFRKDVKPRTQLPVVVYKDDKEYEVHNPRFMPSLRRCEPKARDHTSIITLETCPRKYFYKIVVAMMPKAKNETYLPWGSAYHLFRQRLSELYGYGENTPKVYNDELANKAFSKAAAEGTMYWKKHGKDQPADSRLDWFTTERFIKSCQVGFKHWKLERQRGLVKVIAVEQPFIVQMADGNYTSGRADEVIFWLGKLWGRDFKTTGKDEAWLSRGLVPSDQIRRYTFAEGKLAGQTLKGLIIQGLYNAKSTKKGDKGPEVFEKTIECTQAEIDSWQKDQVTINRTLQIYRELDNWPQYTVHCSYCEYHMVCQKSTEAAQQAHLENHFIHRPWDPTDVNDDI